MVSESQFKEVKPILILSTCPDSAVAEQIAKELVASQYAACVNIVSGLRSCFRWRNKIEFEDELLLLIKTTSVNYLAVEKSIKSLHPYELPEIIAISIKAGLADYLRWIEGNTK